MGPRACGKSSVGQALAAELGWVFIDLDKVYDGRTKNAMRAVLNDPEQYYVELRELLFEYMEYHNVVVALSGGSMINASNPGGCVDTVTACKSRGKLVLVLPSRLDWRNRSILARREGERKYGVPREVRQNLAEICGKHYNERIHFFRGNADLTVYGQEPAVLAHRIATTLKLQPAPVRR